MPDPTYYTNAAGRQIPVFNEATPGFVGAIRDLIKSLAMEAAPRAIVQRPAVLRNAERDATGDAAQPLGNQF